MVLREDLIANAVRFLHNESVQGKAEEDKRAFMTQKGLTEPEIAEALHRAAGGSASSTSAPSSAPIAPPAPPAQFQHGTAYDPMLYPPQYTPQQYVPPPIYYAPPNSKETPWWKVLLGIFGAAGMGFMASNYYRQQQEQNRYHDDRPRGGQSPKGKFQLTDYASPQNATDKSLAMESSVREAPSDLSRTFESLKELLNQQAKDHKELLQRLLEKDREKTQSLQQLTQKVAQLTLNQTIKPQADLSEASLHVLQEALLDAVQKREDSATALAAPVDDSVMDKIEACLKVISQESESKDVAKKSLSMLNTILENLRRHPENEKYRKVNTSSNRFKDRFSEKQRVDEFFSALGFEASGPNFVFPTGPISVTVHKTMSLISDMMKNLDDNWVRAGEPTIVPQSTPTPVMPWASSAFNERTACTTASEGATVDLRDVRTTMSGDDQ